MEKQSDEKNPLLDIDEIIEMIVEGLSYRAIAKKVCVPLSTLHYFVSKAEHSARVRTALECSAQSFDEKAEQILRAAQWNPESTDFDLKKARELAQHFRWKAAKRSPKKYGDKVDVTTAGEKVNNTMDLSHLSFEQLLKLAQANEPNPESGTDSSKP